jgi:hypothetical protein
MAIYDDQKGGISDAALATRLAAAGLTVATASSTTPAISSGTAAVGSGTSFARSDHQHPLLVACVASDVAITSNTTLAAVTGLSVAVAAGKTYAFEANLYTTSNTSGGVKVAIAGTATATAITYDAVFTSAAALALSTRQTALGGSGVGVTAVTVANVRIIGTITVNAAGTLIVQGAQNASNAAATTFLQGSSMRAEQF